MANEITVLIKRQPFDPPFVLKVGDEDVSARVSRMEDNCNVVANIAGYGTYKIDVSDVGFWFIEKKAEPYEVEGVLPEIHGGFTERMFRTVAGSIGYHCGTVISEFREVRDAVLRKNK